MFWKNLNLYFLYSSILRYSLLHLGFFPVLIFSFVTDRGCKKLFPVLIVHLLLWGGNCFDGGDLGIQSCPQLKQALTEDFVKELLKTAKSYVWLLPSYPPHGAFAEESVLFAWTLPLQKPAKKLVKGGFLTFRLYLKKVSEVFFCQIFVMPTWHFWSSTLSPSCSTFFLTFANWIFIKIWAFRFTFHWKKCWGLPLWINIKHHHHKTPQW